MLDTDNAHSTRVTHSSANQRGSLTLMRYPNQSILVYPGEQASHLPAEMLFFEPLRISVQSVNTSAQGAAHVRVEADRRLVVVRDEIYHRNGRKFEPAPALREDAYRRAFVDLARAVLDEQSFEQISELAWQRAMAPALSVAE